MHTREIDIPGRDRQPGELIREMKALHEMIAQLTDTITGLAPFANGIESAIDPIDGGPFPQMEKASGSAGYAGDAAIPQHPAGVAGDVWRCTDQLATLEHLIAAHKERCYQIVERLQRIA